MTLAEKSSAAVCGLISGRVFLCSRPWPVFSQKGMFDMGLSKGLGDVLAAAASGARATAGWCIGRRCRLAMRLPDRRCWSRLAGMAGATSCFSLDRREPHLDADGEKRQADRIKGVPEGAKPLDLMGVGQRLAVSTTWRKLRLEGLGVHRRHRGRSVPSLVTVGRDDFDRQFIGNGPVASCSASAEGPHTVLPWAASTEVRAGWRLLRSRQKFDTGQLTADESALGPVAVRTLAACRRGVGLTQAARGPCTVLHDSSEQSRPTLAR